MDLNKNLEKYADPLCSDRAQSSRRRQSHHPPQRIRAALGAPTRQEAHQAGVGDIQLVFNDDAITLSRFLEARDEVLRPIPNTRWISLKSCSWIITTCSTCTPQPDLFKPADLARITEWQKVAGMANKRLMKYTMQNKVKWCVAAVACPAWLTRLFRGMLEQDAVQKLWDNIFMTTRVDQADHCRLGSARPAVKAHRNF